MVSLTYLQEVKLNQILSYTVCSGHVTNVFNGSKRVTLGLVVTDLEQRLKAKNDGALHAPTEHESVDQEKAV